MNRKVMGILIGFFVLFVGVLFVFVFKARGSDEIGAIAQCVPYNVSLVKGENPHQVFVSWSTEAECVGYVMYGDKRDELNLVAIDTEDLSAKRHSVLMDNLLTTKNYYFIVNSGNVNYGDNGVPLSFSLSSL